jgi:hypothetical protein
MFTPKDVYYGTGGSIVQKSDPINDQIRYRPLGYDCATTVDCGFTLTPGVVAHTCGECPDECSRMYSAEAAADPAACNMEGCAGDCFHDVIEDSCSPIPEEEITTTTEPPCYVDDVKDYCVHMYEIAAGSCHIPEIMRDCERMCCLSELGLQPLLFLTIHQKKLLN